MIDKRKRPYRRTQAAAIAARQPSGLLRLSAGQESVVPRLARQREFTAAIPARSGLETWRVVESALDNARARKTLRLDGGPQARPKRSERIPDLERLLEEMPGLREAARDACADTKALWPGATVNAVNTFTDEFVDHILDDFDSIDAEDLTKWLESLLLVGSAASPSRDSKLMPVRLSTREQFLGFSLLTDQNLAELERRLGEVGRPEAIMVSGVIVAQTQDLIREPKGILAGTTHVYCGKEALGLGRIAVRADVEDAEAGRASVNDAIFHAVRSVAYVVAETPKGGQVLVRALTLPMVAPADLGALADSASKDKMYVRHWLAGCGLTDLVDRGDTSCTAQQAHAARRLHDEYLERTGQKLPIVIPAIRIEHARSHRRFSSPIGPYKREMPGNTCGELRRLRRILGSGAQVWLAEAGVEEGDTPVQPDWKIRMPEDRYADGVVPIVHPDIVNWIQVFRSGDELLLSELEQPVALGYDRHEDLVLLRALGEGDCSSGTRPPLWYVASRSLRSDPNVAASVGELLRRLHGSRRDSAELRDARIASFAAPARVLGGRAKNPRPWMTRELERQLAFLAKLLRCEEDAVAPLAALESHPTAVTDQPRKDDERGH